MALALDDDVVEDVENVRVLDGVRDDDAVAPLRGSVPPLIDGDDEKVPREELRRRGDGLRRLQSINLLNLLLFFHTLSVFKDCAFIFLTPMGEISSHPTKHANKIIILIF